MGVSRPDYGVFFYFWITQTKNIKFFVEPYVRFKGESGEQATMFFLDPSGNALEFKSFKDQSSIFEK